MLRKFRKKPVVIDAVLWTGHNFEMVRELDSERKIYLNKDYTLTIETLEGNHIAQKGDWIIKGIKGEVYPCKPDIFEQTYDEVKPNSSPK